MNDVLGSERLAENMDRARAEQGLPCVAFGLVHAGEPVFFGASVEPGQPAVDASTRFRASSLTKSVTAATTLLLRDRGLIELEAPLTEYLPWATTLERDAEPIRVRHLLTMTAGFPTDDPWIDELDDLSEEGLDAILAEGASLCRAPGAEYEYSNVGYALLGRVIAAVTGCDYRDVVAEEVLRPVGLTQSGYAVPDADLRVLGHRRAGADRVVQAQEIPVGAFAPSGGMWSSVQDLARWLGCLESAAAGEPGRGLPPHIAREMSTPRTVVRLDRRKVADEDIAVAHAYGMGLFASTYSDVGRVVFHQGGCPAFGAELRWHPASRWGVVAMANSGYPVLQHPARHTLQAIVGSDIGSIRAEAARRALWPHAIQAMAWAESLLASWDDMTFDRFAAPTLDRQVPRHVRRGRIEQVARERGPFARDEQSLRSASPAHALWRVEGERGDAWLEVLLTPEATPRVQHLGLLDDASHARVL